MKFKSFLIIMFAILLLAVPATTVNGEVADTETPPAGLGVLPVGSPNTLTFAVNYSGCDQATAIYQVNYTAAGYTYTGFTATMNGADVTNQFTDQDESGTVMISCDAVQPPNGVLSVDVGFQSGYVAGNYSFDWHAWYVGFPPPPNIPDVVEVMGSTDVELVYGVELPLWAGWNLIGVPTYAIERGVEEVFGEHLGLVESVFGFDNEKKEYLTWIAGLPPQFNTLSEMLPHHGYWVKALGDFNLTIYTTAPAQGGPGLSGQTVYIGYIAASDEGLSSEIPYLLEVVEPELNNHAGLLGYDVAFEFIPLSANGDPATHLEKVMYLKSIGVDLFIGGRWSSMAQAALNYVNQHDMLMFSPSSTLRYLSIEGDNLYRMCPDDRKQGPVMTRLLLDHDIDAIVVLQRGDVWGDGLNDVLEANYTGAGGVVWERVRYDLGTTDFGAHLSYLNSEAQDAVAVYGWDHVAVELLSFQESLTILNQSQYYPTLYNLTWYGSEATALDYNLVNEIPEIVSKVKLYSTYPAPDYSTKYYEFQDRYETLVGGTFSFYTACTYDISTVLADAILQAQSTQGLDVIPLIQDISYNTYGTTGWCCLNSAGDRWKTDYDIWGYGDEFGYDIYRYGYYDSDTDMVVWIFP